MPAAAAALAAVWFLTAFALRIGIQVARHRDTGVRVHGESPRSWAWWARIGFVVATLVVAGAPVAAAAGGLDPIAALDRPALAAGGLVVGLAGIALTFWAQLAMGASWRIGVDPGERTELVTGGPFTVVRNPIFSTMALTAAGLTLAAPTGPGLAGLVALLASLEIQVRLVEEPHLHQLHGPAYATYTTQVPRFLPRPRRAGVRVSRGGGRRRGPGAGR
jgi:protein-S-isoprenylcysteine O-methyltransferase Ste14